MSNKKFAVISKNERLAALIEAELLLLNINVECVKELTFPNDEFDGYIFDCLDDPTILKSNIPIKIAITEKEPSEDVLREATHVLRYPFRLDELRGIFISSSSRADDSEAERESLIFADEKTLSVRLNGRKIKLSRYEFTILELLCKNSGKCVPRALLSEALGGAESNITEVYICHLRKKLEADGNEKIIHTVRQKGYMTSYKMK